MAGGGGAREVDAGGAGGTADDQEPLAEELEIATHQPAPTGIAIDAMFVYWCNRDAGTIVKCPLDGCGREEPTLLASELGKPLGLAVDDSRFVRRVRRLWRAYPRWELRLTRARYSWPDIKGLSAARSKGARTLRSSPKR